MNSDIEGPEWQMENGREATQQEMLQVLREMPVPIYSYDKGYKAGKCLVRLPDGSIRDDTPDDLPPLAKRYTRWM